MLLFKPLLAPALLLAISFPGLHAEAAARPASTDPLAPKIFHAPVEAIGSDIIPLQGTGLGSANAFYTGPSGKAIALTVVNRVGDTWLAVQLPASLPSPLSIYLQNGHGASPQIPLNAAVPKHLDATRLVPGGAFRLLGINLLVPGSTPSVTVGGMPATVNMSASTSNMLAVTAPAGLKPTSAAVVTVNNGGGLGAVPLPQPVEVDAGTGDPLGLGVGWGAGFTFANATVVAHPACDGTTDDTAAIESAVVSASQQGGGAVQLPIGHCRITSTVNLASKVILKGMGQSQTIITYEGNYPINANKADLVGLQDLALVNAGPTQEGLIWQYNTRSFIRRVTLSMGVSRQLFLTNNRDFVVDGNTITQTGSYDEQNPYLFTFSYGLVFTNNHSTNSEGSPTFKSVHDSVFLSNHFTRDASSQNENPVVAHHGFVADFAYRISLIGNTFDVINGPVTAKLRNDGETILTEGGGGSRTENFGTVKTASATTITDGANVINVDPFALGSIPETYAVAIVAGTGAGQRRRVLSYANSTLTVDRPWDVVPDTTSVYSTFVWGLKDVLIIGNTLIDNPRGIWLYQCSVEGILIAGNAIREGGGIFLRSYENTSIKMRTIQDDVMVRDNAIQNTTGLWLSYIVVADVSSDNAPFATGFVNIGIRHNTVVANLPNQTSSIEDYANREGYTVLLHIETGGAQISPANPNILGTTIVGNTCTNCTQSYVIGTGDYGTSLVGNSPNWKKMGAVTDQINFGSQYGGSQDTLKQ